MSKVNLLEEIIQTIRSWQDEDRNGEISVDNGNIECFINDIGNVIDANCKELDVNKIDIEIEKAVEEHKMLKELGADNLMFAAGKIIGLKAAKELLK